MQNNIKEEIINGLKNTSYWNKFIVTPNVQIAYFGGSQLTGITDENSDYDIICLIDGSEYEDSNYLMWRDKKIHFIYRPIESFENTCLNSGLQLCTFTQFGELKNNNTIFLCNNEELKNRLLNKSDYLLKEGFEHLILQKKCIIEDIVKDSSIKEENKTKYLYHIIYAKRKLFKEEIDKEYLKNLKRIRWRKIDNKYIQMCIEDLKDISNYIKENNIKEKYLNNKLNENK